MRVLTIVCSVAVILAFVFVAEYVVVESFFDELRTNAEIMKNSVSNGIISNDEALNIVNMWENSKGKLYIFENHEYFKTLEDNVYNLKFSTQNREQRNIIFALDKLKVLADESEFDFALSFGNIF